MESAERYFKHMDIGPLQRSLKKAKLGLESADQLRLVSCSCGAPCEGGGGTNGPCEHLFVF